MTREEQIAFCRKCKNRKFDTQQGLICGLTDEKAAFEDSCPDFVLDEYVKDKDYEPQVEMANHEMISKISENSKERFRAYQDFGSAVIGGLLVSLLGAIIWAFITTITGYQIGYVAIGIGLLVGFGVRFFGAGVDQKFGILGGVLALFSCLLGNFFAQIVFLAQSEGIAYFQALQLFDWSYLPLIYTETFSPMDLLFYGIAVFEGYKFGFRAISPDDLQQLKSPDFDPIPPGYKVRKPAVIASFVLCLLLLLKFNQGVNGVITYEYEDGSKMSSGEYIDGKENGVWEYWYPNGEKQISAIYDNGIPDGEWIFYYDSGHKMREGTYQKGSTEGLWINYHPGGIVSDSGRYVSSSESGTWAFYHDNGLPMQVGNYVQGNQTGLWLTYHKSGKVESEGKMEKGENVGLWKFWYPNGSLKSELNHIGGKTEIINAWNLEGNQTVKDGSGFFTEVYETGEILSSGKIVNKKKIGRWTTLSRSGSKFEEGIHTDDEYLIESVWGPTGDLIVTGGNGEYIRYTDDHSVALEQGDVVNGKREGQWFLYYETTGDVLIATEYENGKMNGNRYVFDEYGVIIGEGQMKNDLQDGEWKWHYANGELETAVTFKNGKKEGIQEYWNIVGQKFKEIIYENGDILETKMLEN